MENKDPISSGKQKNKFLLLASTLFVLLIVLLVLVINNNKVSAPGTQTQNTPGTNTTVSPVTRRPQVIASAPPQVAVTSWIDIKKPASLPTTASTYAFKTDYTFNDVKAFAAQLETDGKVQRNGNVVMAYSLPQTDTDAASLLAYNLTNGTFIFNSSDGLALPAGSNTENKVVQLLKKVGVYDTTLTSVYSYKSKSKPGVTYYEFHRNWNKVGLPILSPVGLLNIAENDSLSKLAIETVDTRIPRDADIYATSDRTDGYARRDDFNTLTVGVEDTAQSVTFIKSMIRPFQTAAPSAAALLTFDQAVEKLKGGMYEFALTTPTGTGGEMPWDKIYPLNKAEAETARVIDSVLVYLEQPASAKQTELKPYYIFRANAVLKSGYRALIIAAVPATGNTQAKGFSFIKEVYAQEDPGQGQQQGSFDFSPTPSTGVTVTGSNLPTVPPITLTPNPNGGDQETCVPAASELSPVYNIGGAIYGWTNFRNDTMKVDNKDGFWYYVPTETDSELLANLENILNAIRSGIGTNVGQTGNTPPPTSQPTVVQTAQDDQGQKQSTFIVPTTVVTDIPVNRVELGEYKVRKIDKVIKDVNRIVDFCPIRVTGDSPTIFIYGTNGAHLDVLSGATVSFADPSLTATKSWSVNVGNQGKLDVNGHSRDWIYYEYENASFDRPTVGWTVKKNAIDSFVKNVLAKGLGLTANETERAVFELKHAASRVNNDSLFVGMISEQEVNAKLPLTVSSAEYAVHRVYFYVGSSNGNVSQPTLTKVPRSTSMVLELGSYGER